MTIYIYFSKQLNLVAVRVTQLQESFLILRKPSTKIGLMDFSQLTSVNLNRKLIRWISNFLYSRKLIISINDQLNDPTTPIHGDPQGSPVSLILSILYVSDIPQLLDAQVSLSQFADDIAICKQSPGIRSINLSLKNT